MAPRVLHVAQPTVDGVAVVVAQLVRDQVARGWHVTVACPGRGWLAGAAVSSGAHLIDWQATRSPGAQVAAEAWRLSRIVRRTRPDIVHLHSAKAGLAGRLASRGRHPTIYQPHGWSFLAMPSATAPVARSWERFAGRWTSAIACVSAGERWVGESARIRTNWLATPNGIDLAVFPPAGYAERHEARRRLGLAAAPLAVCLARVCRQKGQDSLLAAWPSVRATVPGAQLALVGDLGADGATILNRARFPEGAFHVGHDDDPRSWYAAANVVVAASRWEGMALTLREAIACGRSVVATDVPGVRESVPDGAGGVVPANDSEALAAALFRRLSDLAFADTEGATGAVHAHRFFGIEDSNNAMAAAYDQVLGHLGMSSR